MNHDLVTLEHLTATGLDTSALRALVTDVACPAHALEPFARNGYARLRDLDSPRLEDELRALEGQHARFIAQTRELWTPEFAHTGDKLYNWSRRWEYPYCAWNLRRQSPGRVLDAGSGVTFFPYVIANAGWRVSCADLNPRFTPMFETANRLTGRDVAYRVSPIERLDWPDATFDAVMCVSVLEHAPRRVDAMDEFARVLKPGGRLVLTMDVSLSRDCDVLFEDVAVILAQLERRFEPEYPLDLHRPTDLLTTERMLAGERWRLSWRAHPNPLRRWLSRLRNGPDFHTLAVLGTTWRKRG